MDERLKELQKRAVEFWKKYDKKQKTLIISITAVVLIALVIMAVVITKPTYVELITCTDTLEAADVTTALNGGGITYVSENDGLTIMVEEETLNDAQYLIAQEGLTATAFSLEDYLENSSFSMTTEDKKRMWQTVLEDNMRLVIESFDYVKSADVMFTMPEDKLTVLERDEETYVSVKLALKKSIPDGAAESMARFIATAVGNDTTNCITIIDGSGRTLFQGSEMYTDNGSLTVSQQESIRNRFNSEVIENTHRIAIAVGAFTNVVVAPALDITFDQIEEITTEYYNPDEVVDNEYIYESEGVSGPSGVPGTDSNDDDTTYYIDTGDGSSTSVTINKTDYAVSSKITSLKGEQGTCNRNNSSLAVTLNKYVYYNEDVLREAGELDDITWEEYQANNSEPQAIEVVEGLQEAISAATGIPVDKIEILSYIIPVFEASSDDGEFIQNILPIIVAIVILALLGFMVWRSLRPVEINELEPELSVEELLSATREKQGNVEEIDLEEKSETRKAIEKFVDENPQSAALLLRNWLNDDWD